MGVIFLNAFFAGIASVWYLWAILMVLFAGSSFLFMIRAQKNLFKGFFGSAKTIGQSFHDEQRPDELVADVITETAKVGGTAIANVIPALIAGALGGISAILLAISIIYYIVH